MIGYILIGIEEENGRPKLPVKGLEPELIDAIQLDILNKCNLIECSFLSRDGGGVVHDLQFGQFVCHEFLIFLLLTCRRQRRAGTQTANYPLCVPKLTTDEVRGGVRVARHKIHYK